MNRREVVAGLLGAAVSGGSHSNAVGQSALPRLGLLAAASPETFRTPLAGLFEGLAQAGLVEGRTLALSQRWARGSVELLPGLAADLVRLPVQAIVTIGGNVAAFAAQNATSSIPIVLLTGDDPVTTGLVESLARPGGNMTGVTWRAAELAAKSLELIREVFPPAGSVGGLFNPTRPTSRSQVDGARTAAALLGQDLVAYFAASPDEIDAAFAAASRARLEAMFLAVDAFYIFHRTRVIEAARRHGIPTVYFQREFVEMGGLMSYGAREADAARICGDYAARILKGMRPNDLPVQQSTRVELVVNLGVARSLGLAIPPGTLARADEVVE